MKNRELLILRNFWQTLNKPLEGVFVILPIGAFLGYVFFYRGFEMGFFSFSTFYPILLTYLLVYFGIRQFNRQLQSNLRPTVSNLSPVILYLLIYFSLQILWNPERVDVLSRFAVEVFGNLGSVLIGFWIVKKYGLDFFCKILLWAALIIGILVMVKLTSLDTIRRIGGTGQNESSSSLAVAVNHLGHAFAFASVCGMHQLYKFVKSKQHFYSILLGVWLVLLIVMTFLTGSRAAVLGLLVSVIFGVFYLGAGRRRILNRSTVFKILGVSIAGFTAVITVYAEKINALLQRFDVDMLVTGILNRWDSFTDAVNTANEWAIIFGNPWKYQLLQNVDPIMYPHNWFLSITLHLGIIAAVLFAIYLLIIIYTVITSPRIQKIDKWMLLSCTAIVLTYVLTSGRLTRVITIFVLLGVCWGAANYRSKDFWSLNFKSNKNIKKASIEGQK